MTEFRSEPEFSSFLVLHFYHDLQQSFLIFIVPVIPNHHDNLLGMMGIIFEDSFKDSNLERLIHKDCFFFTLLSLRALQCSISPEFFSPPGNIIKNEALYLARIHPLSLGSSLESTDLKSLLDHVVQFSLAWLHNKLGRQRLRLQIYMKDKCPEGHEVKKATFGPPDGLKRLTWWCPQCQPLVSPKEMDMPLIQGT